jgi:hypothetical protein
MTAANDVQRDLYAALGTVPEMMHSYTNKGDPDPRPLLTWQEVRVPRPDSLQLSKLSAALLLLCLALTAQLSGSHEQLV